MERSFRRWSCVGVVVGLLVPLASAQPLPTATVGTGFSQPVFGTSAPGAPNTLYVVQQGGAIRPLSVQGGTTGTIGPALLDLSAVTGTNFISGGEQGLLGLAFHPDFQTNGQGQGNGLMYVKYTYGGAGSGAPNGGALRVEQYQVTNGVADATSRKTVLQWDHDAANTNHNGGWIGFNPVAAGGSATAPRYNLYVNTGDGGGGNDLPNNAQNTGVFQGKILRVNVGDTGVAANNGYTIPAGNRPAAGGDKAEIYSYGLRNPYRAGFDRTTGNLYIGDVGQGAREEVNFIANGAAGGQNFGWRLREGNIQTPGAEGGPIPPGYVAPIHDYDHTVGQSITGGYVYHGTAKDTDGTPLDGTYFFADYVAKKIFSLRYDGTTVTAYKDRTADFALGSRNYSSFAEDGAGNLYVIDYGGSVIRLVPVPEPASVGLCVGVGVAAVAGWRRWRRA